MRTFGLNIGKLGGGGLSGLKKLFQVFGTAPTYKTDAWYFSDSTNKTIGAKSYGYALEAIYTESNTNIYALSQNIAVDLLTDGLKFEMLIKWSGSRISHILSDSQGSTVGVMNNAFNGLIQIIAKLSVSPFSKSIQFTNCYCTPVDSYKWVKIETLNKVITCKVADANDPTYSSAITQSIDLTSDVNLLPMSISGIGGYGNTLHGGICYVNIAGNIFDFQSGPDSLVMFSRTSNIFARISSASFAAYRLLIKPTALILPFSGGFSTLYFQDKNTGINSYCHIPYENGISIVNTIITTFLTSMINNTTRMYLAEEHQTGFGYGSQISLPASLSSYDSGATFFTGSTPNILKYSQIPTQLNKQWFFNLTNSLFLLNDQYLTKKWKYNLVGKNVFVFGDSTAGELTYDLMAKKNGAIVTTSANGGYTTEQLYELAVANLGLNPNYFNTYDVIFVGCGYNDYGQLVSLSTFTNYYNQLISLINNNTAENAIIVCLGVHVFAGGYNPSGGADVDNGAGLTHNVIRSTQQSISTNYNQKYINLNLANLTLGITNCDLHDNVHGYSPSAAKKILDVIIAGLWDE